MQYALPSLLEHYHRGDFTLPRIVEKASHAPARLFHLKDRGFIREGCWADLVLVDLEGDGTVTPEAVLGRCGWSPFEGYHFRSTVVFTVVNGSFAYRDGRVMDDPRGLPLAFDRP